MHVFVCVCMSVSLCASVCACTHGALGGPSVSLGSMTTLVATKDFAALLLVSVYMNA